MILQHMSGTTQPLKKVVSARAYEEPCWHHESQKAFPKIGAFPRSFATTFPLFPPSSSPIGHCSIKHASSALIQQVDETGIILKLTGACTSQGIKLHWGMQGSSSRRSKAVRCQPSSGSWAACATSSAQIPLRMQTSWPPAAGRLWLRTLHVNAAVFLGG